MAIETSDWIDFFPSTPEGVRPLQEKAINFILNHLNQGTENILFEGPTGTGKSYIAYVVALYYAIEHGLKTRFLTPTRFLENQYIRDFGPLGLKQLHSAVHYRCPGWGSCAIGRGSEIVLPPLKNSATDPVPASTAVATAATVESSVKCKHQDSCPYLKARTEFQVAPIAVTNTAYALTCARFGHDFVKADLTIFDEGHRLGNQICELFKIEIHFRLVDVIPAQGDEFAWLRDVYRPNIEALLEDEIKELETSQQPVNIHEIEKEIARLSTILANIDFILKGDSCDWIVSRNARGLLFQPIWATRIAPSLLGFLSKRRVLMSATFLNQTIHLESLGL
jgi:Rad3-related DNA helicase